MEASNEPDEILFGRFFMFFIKESGFELQFEQCVSCGRTNLEKSELSYNMEMGILCENCRNDYLESFRINAELFDYLFCLKHSKQSKIMNSQTTERAIVFMEKYLMYHFPEFKGIQSLQLFK